MFCKHCGTTVETQNRYCPACGQSVEAETSEQKKKMPGWLKAFLLILLAAGLILGWIFYSAPNLTHTVEGQLTALKQNKISEAYYEYTSKEFQTTTSIDAFKQFLKIHPILLETKSINIEKHNIDDGQASLTGILTGSEEETALIKYYFIREGNRWKILRIEISPSTPRITPQDHNAVSLADEFSESETHTPNTADQLKTEEEEQDPLFQTVLHFLHDIRQQQAEDSYKYVTKEFAAATPIEQFKTYLQNTPILTNYNKVSVGGRKLKGTEGYLRIILDPSKGAIPVEFHLVKEEGQWKIWSFQVVLPSSEVSPALRDKSLLITPVRSMLNALAANNYPEVYREYFSSDYKTRVPLNKFQEALEQDAYILHEPAKNYKEPRIVDDNKGLITVELTLGDRSELLEFTVKKDEGQWKIDSWSSATPSTKTDAQPINAKALESVVNSQMSAIHSKNIDKAYLEYTSKGFKETTSLKDFESFLAIHPYISNYKSLTLPQLTFNGNIAVLSGTITANDQHAYPIEYQFAKEGDSWKILHINVLTEGSQKEKGSLEFSKILIGRTISHQGLVQDPQTILKADQNDIYINLFVKGGIAGTKIEMKFEHLQSGSKIPTISTTLIDSGETIVTFVFSPPPDGWPRGLYQLQASSSTGTEQIYSFKME